MNKQRPQAPGRPPKPKRGALPTPKEEIERATPYVPGVDPADERPIPGPPLPPKVDDNKRG